MGNLVSLSRQDAIGIITIDNPPLNLLGPGVAEGVVACLDEAAADHSVKALILRGAGRTFVAGADIREFIRIVSGERPKDVGLRPMMERLEDFPKPVVAAIHGHALGGGLETAMACHYRVAEANAQLGQPEVKLGLIPGAGGTQRLPRLVGLAKAAMMCGMGEPLSAAEARRYGLVNVAAEDDWMGAAMAFARNLIDRRIGPSKTRELTRKLGAEHSNRAILTAIRPKVSAKWPGRSAPQRALDAVGAAARLRFDEGIEMEERLFFECLFSEESRALIRLFFGQRKATALGEDLRERLWKSIRGEALALAAEGAPGGEVNGALLAFGFSRPPLEEEARPPASPEAGEWIRRCLAALINEAARILGNHPMLSAIDIDVAAVDCCGFPSHRGGPLWFADETGLVKILDSLRAYHSRMGERWTPAPLLEKLSVSGGRLSG